MKRCNKRQVIKSAHRLYGNGFHRKGRSWSECLRAVWGREHDAARAREAKAAKFDVMTAAGWITHKEGVNRGKDERTWGRGLTSDGILKAMGYETGWYCGD